mmetsp:Transcript_37990/g.98068  ORF Transcript_37990/g.98068 Transcript_37990/m.98068 type:complete len:120 (-) Transcript_37990:30-389(-)
MGRGVGKHHQGNKRRGMKATQCPPLPSHPPTIHARTHKRAHKHSLTRGKGLWARGLACYGLVKQALPQLPGVHGFDFAQLKQRLRWAKSSTPKKQGNRNARLLQVHFVINFFLSFLFFC